MIPWRLIPYKAYHAFENMSFDETILESYQQSKLPVLRLYSWRPAGISIGKYQDAAECLNIENCKKDGVSIVRRMTGGGAILHNNELTYSLVCSEEDIGCAGMPVKKSFEKLNSFILRFYKGFELKPRYARDIRPSIPTGERAAFCFSGSEEYDVMIEGKKIGGNAQARRKNIIFQHGSLPLSVDEEKTSKYFRTHINYNNFTSLEELTDRKISLYEAVERFIRAFDCKFKFALKEIDLTFDEKNSAEKLMNKKYSKDEWNYKNITVEA